MAAAGEMAEEVPPWSESENAVSHVSMDVVVEVALVQAKKRKML